MRVAGIDLALPLGGEAQTCATGKARLVALTKPKGDSVPKGLPEPMPPSASSELIPDRTMNHLYGALLALGENTKPLVLDCRRIQEDSCSQCRSVLPVGRIT
jgi:hypothetical protein